MNKWYEEQSTDSDVVISSRIRLARNIKGFYFQERMNRESAIQLVTKVTGLTKDLELKENQKFYHCNVNKLRDIDKASMVEWHIISPLLAEKELETGLIVSEDEGISVMVNEEDHLRIQAISSGMNMEKAFLDADRVDDFFSEQLGYAYDDRYGYLTSCPTNVGTGLRASYMVFLPALNIAGKIEKLAEEIGRYGAQIRGIYGEGTKGLGHIFQISNKTTLGRSEKEIIDNLEKLVDQVVFQERKRREYLINMNMDEIEDKVYRSYGVLKYAKKINTVDALMMLSQLKLGMDAGLMKLSEPLNIHKLMMEVTPGNLQKSLGKSVGRGERDRYRAEYINNKLPQL
ncbi:protein arginine kinase [Lachnoclostridium phytofermentans]|uniref:ATP:guanido phosphotransferase n=1 Tax=Lachnoclostridium phytofermentans (strain ATCC 700394 / DSM 18823 / ISDg) TaxID=357809 RepID=A9KHW6_LACP7|nr:protein arginine kinase [Lachnoclostridium phytofermentans]ABX43813.1 ATP:guanido phosphotransferase [Lachnoclostridium phytofermentans ISDg]